jgi:hypothetical protein
MQTCLPDTFTNYNLHLVESFALFHTETGVYNELVLMKYDSLYFRSDRDPLVVTMMDIYLSNIVAYRQKSFPYLEHKGFWRWCITLKIAGITDFVHRPEF